MIIHWHDGENELDCKCPASDLWPDEAAIVAKFEAAEPAPESYDAPCEVYSHGDDGWHCAITGDHEFHHNAAGDVTW